MSHRPGREDRSPADGQRLAPLLQLPLLGKVVPHLPPEALHQLIRHAGLERCVDLVEAATGAQLTAILDLDLWGASRPGRDEQLDADRFGEWIETLVDRDAATAARVVARLDPSLVVAGLSRYVRVLDPGVLEPTESTDDEPREGGLFATRGLAAEIGGHIVQARRADAWDAIVSLLAELSAAEQECFHAVMRGCRRLSSAGREVDGLDVLFEEPEQFLHDVAVQRDERRAERGFTTAADARAFLELARRRRSADPRASHQPDPLTVWAPPEASVVDALASGLPEGGHAGQREAGGLHPLMEYLRRWHPDLCLVRGRELAVLANALLAGCPLQGRSFTPQEALDAVVATCALGLERLPVAPGVDHLIGHGLIAVFEDGWAALHREVSLYVAERLLAILRGASLGDSDTLNGLHALRRSLETHLVGGAPWLAREALDVLSILDTPAWYGLLGLLGECPVIPAIVTAVVERRTGRIDPTAFAFIATTAQIDTVRAFMLRLPQLLAG